MVDYNIAVPQPYDNSSDIANALRFRAAKQAEAENQLKLQAWQEDRAYELERRKAAAANAAAGRARDAEIADIYATNIGVSPAAVGARGMSYSGTGMSTDPYARTQNELLKRGYVPQAQDIAEFSNKVATGEETKARTNKLGLEAKGQDIKNVGDRLAYVQRFAGMVSSPEDAAAYSRMLVKEFPEFAALSGSPDDAARRSAEAFAKNPDAWRMHSLNLTAEQLVQAHERETAAVQPKLTEMDVGGRKLMVDTNPRSPTYNQDVSWFDKTLTPAEVSANEKTKWEQEHPDREIREDANGVYSVNKKDPTDIVRLQVEGKNLVPKTDVANKSTIGKLIAERDALPPDSPLRARYDDAIKKEASGSGATRSEIGKLVDERNALPENDPLRVSYDAAIAKASGGVTPAQIEGAVAGAEDAVAQIDKLLNHPGFSEAVGASWGTSYIPGTDARGAIALHNQVTGTAFLDAYNSLRGTGSITEIEGKKATAAKTRMDLSTSEKDYIEAAKEFQAILKRGIEREKARLKSGGAAAAPAATSSIFDAADAIIGGK
jgi:hypothetical protein